MRNSMLRVGFPGLSSLVTRPPRWLCTPSETALKEVQDFLVNASRPILGKGKSKTCAGQRPIDLTKHTSRLEGLDMAALLEARHDKLKELGLPAADRKRLMRYTYKVRQGYTHQGKPGDWKAWKAPIYDFCPH